MIRFVLPVLCVLFASLPSAHAQFPTGQYYNTYTHQGTRNAVDFGSPILKEKGWCAYFVDKELSAYLDLFGNKDVLQATLHQNLQKYRLLSIASTLLHEIWAYTMGQDFTLSNEGSQPIDKERLLQKFHTPDQPWIYTYKDGMVLTASTIELLGEETTSRLTCMLQRKCSFHVSWIMEEQMKLSEHLQMLQEDIQETRRLLHLATQREQTFETYDAFAPNKWMGCGISALDDESSVCTQAWETVEHIFQYAIYQKKQTDEIAGFEKEQVVREYNESALVQNKPLMEERPQYFQLKGKTDPYSYMQIVEEELLARMVDDCEMALDRVDVEHKYIPGDFEDGFQAERAPHDAAYAYAKGMKFALLQWYETYFEDNKISIVPKKNIYPYYKTLELSPESIQK